MSETEFIAIFSSNLKDILDDYRMSVQELADETGVDKTTIYRYLKRELMPSVKTIVNIAVVLDVDITELIPVYEKIY